MNIDDYSYLVELLPHKYNLLPPKSLSQDLYMAPIKSKNRLPSKYIFQKDGSRIKVLYTKVFKPMDIIDRIMSCTNWKTTILPETKVPVEVLKGIMARTKLVYRGYIMNYFINSFRVMPILIDIYGMTFYNASGLFPKLIPEDNIGVLIMEDVGVKGIEIEGHEPQLIEYVANIRMCPHCGVVSDHSKRNKNPWIQNSIKNSLFG